MNKAKRFAKCVDSVNKRVGQAASYLVLPVTAIVVVEVILRYIFNRPTIWTWDVNVQLVSVYVILGGGYSLLSGNFVRIDLFVERLSAVARKKVNIIFGMVALLCIGMLLWEGFNAAHYSVLVGEKYTSIWKPPLYPLRIVVAIGITLLFLQVVSGVIHDLPEKAKR